MDTEFPENLTPEDRARLNELSARRAFCRLCIKIVDESDKGDIRRAEALAEYQRQLAVIDEKITAITGRPPDVVVGLKPAILFPKSEGA